VIAELCILDLFLAVAHPIPRVVALLAHDLLEPTADEEFHGVEAGLIHVAQHRMHHAGGHVVRPEAGVAVAQGRVDDANFVHVSSSHLTGSILHSLCGGIETSGKIFG
jgi:hypothetical protein